MSPKAKKSAPSISPAPPDAIADPSELPPPETTVAILGEASAGELPTAEAAVPAEVSEGEMPAPPIVASNEVSEGEIPAPPEVASNEVSAGELAPPEAVAPAEVSEDELPMAEAAGGPAEASANELPAASAAIAASTAPQIAPTTQPAPRWWRWPLIIGIVALAALFVYYFYQNTLGLPLPDVKMVDSSAFQPRLTFPPQGNNLIADPVGIGVDSQGNIYVANRRDEEMRKFDPSGTLVLTWTLLGDLGGSQLPEGMLVYHDHIYALDKNTSHIDEYDTSGKLLTVHNRDNHAGISSPNGFCFDRDGNFYVASTAGNTIIKMDQQDQVLGVIGGRNLMPPDRQLYQPFGCAVSADGAIYAVSIDGLIRKYDKDGNYLKTLPTHWLGHAVEVGIRTATDFARNRVYIADPGDSLLVMIDPSSDAITAYGGPGHAPGLFTLIEGVAVNANGDIYTVEGEERRIQVFNRP